MAGRGDFQAITPADMERLLALPEAERWDATALEKFVVFGIPMDKAWVAIHRSLSDGSVYGMLGEPPLDMAVLGYHLICRTALGSFVYLKRPAEVADIAQELSRLSREKFVDRLAALPEADDDMVALELSPIPDEIEYVWP